MKKVYSFTAEKLYSDHWHKVMDITYRQRAGRVEETRWRNIVHRRWQPQLAGNVCSAQASCTATIATTNMSTIDLEHDTWYALQKVQQNLTKRLLSRENKQQTRKRVNPFTPTVAISVQLQSILCQTGLIQLSFVMFDIRALWFSGLSVKSARMTKITNDRFNLQYGTGCFVAVPIWQQWAVKGLRRTFLPTQTGRPMMMAGTAAIAMKLMPIGPPTSIASWSSIFFLRLHCFLPQNVQPDGLQ